MCRKVFQRILLCARLAIAYYLDLTSFLLTSSSQSYSWLPPLKMPTHLSQLRRDKAFRLSAAHSTERQSLTTNSEQMKQDRVGFNKDHRKFGQDYKNRDKHLGLPRNSIINPNFPTKMVNEAQDIEMLDVLHDRSITSNNNAAIRRRTCGSNIPPSGVPIIHVRDDGAYYEIGSATSIDADFASSNTPQPQRERGMANVQHHDSQKQSSGGADHGEERTTAYRSPPALDEEPDVQILDAAVARRFPVYTNSKIGPGDYLTDEEFERMMEANAPLSAQEINDEEGVDAEDVVTEDFIVDHLRSLVIAPSTETSSRSVKNSWPGPPVAGTVNLKGLNLCRGLTVELQNGSFLWIDSLKNNIWGPVTIKGYQLARDGYCGAKLPSGRLNELVWINEIDEEGHQVGLESVLQEVQVSEVKRVRDVVYTNCPWPTFSSHEEIAGRGLTQAAINNAAESEHGKLYCRWKFIQVKSRLKNDDEACLTLLSREEATDKVEPSLLRKAWRGDQDPIPGGSSTMPAFDVETGKMTSIPSYSLGDCFCGAGGVSRGAIQAGLQVAWGFDLDPDAIKAHAENFAAYGTKSLQLADSAIIDLIKKNPRKYHVDIAHYSPPCQPFSSANHNKNVDRDFLNQKALFSLHDLTQLLKPRIATIEETAGLMHRHGEWFNALVHIFTNLGYSIRWKIVRCNEHGIPQNRVRLLLMAAA